jgi:hypothetical protein
LAWVAGRLTLEGATFPLPRRSRKAGRRPAVTTTVAPAAGRIYLGMDVSRDTIAAAVLRPGEDVPAVELISNDGEMVRRLIGKFADWSVLAACYEAGPGGYELHRLLTSMGVACDVVAPALIPKAAADRVKTDRRDCARTRARLGLRVRREACQARRRLPEFGFPGSRSKPANHS